MAVYKPTYCTPLLTVVDPRVGLYGEKRDVNYGDGKENLYVEKPIKFITCKVDSSNKVVTGYKVKLLDKNNNQIFPTKDSEGNYKDYISPISELQKVVFGYQNDGTPGVNSGCNGTTLQIPFFQNIVNKNLQSGTDNDFGFYNSFNAIYYNSPYLVDHVISSGLETNNPYSEPDNWTEYVDSKGNKDGSLVYNNWIDDNAKKENKITLDGDLIQENEVILFNSEGSQALNGIYKAVKLEITKTVIDEEDETRIEKFDYYVTKLEKIRNCEDINLYFARQSMSSITKIYVTVLHGDNFHDTYWYMIKGSSVFQQDPEPVPWVDYEGNSLIDFGCNDDMYKWQITLYQGDYTLNEFKSLKGDGNIAQYVTYDDVDPKWMDMTLMSGKILGTTSERVQLGRFFVTDSLGNTEGVIPEGTDSDSLVLQETFMAVGKSEDFSEVGNRSYVKTYDSTLGHVYLSSSDLNATKLSDSSYTYCQFYKHSNDIEYILDTDIINYTFTEEVPIQYYAYTNSVWVSFGTDTTSEVNWYDQTSANTRKLVVATTDSEKARFKALNSGDLILLMGQSKTKQNGVYELSKDGSNYTIKRASSYSDWSAYLGKIIFTLGADNTNYVRTNIECLAQAGSYMLWNPLNTSDNSGSSSLIFVKERPILIFKNKVYKTFDFYSNNRNLSDVQRYPSDHISVGTKVSSSGEIDGTEVQEGNTVIFYNGVYGTVVDLNAAAQTYNIEIEGSIFGEITEYSLSPIQYIYIEQGKTYGKKTFKTIKNIDSEGGNLQETEDLFTAQIMRNTTTRTFITAWTGLEKKMKLCLLGNKYAHFADGTYSKWITVEDFNDKLYYIDHSALSEALKSEKLSTDTDDTIPWHYDIRFFFRSSEENPFYSCETPYFKIYKNGNLFSDLSCDYLSYDLNWHEGDNFYYQDYAVEDGTSKFKTSYNRQYTVLAEERSEKGEYVPHTKISGHAVTFKATVVHFSQTSWESFKWILYNSSDNVTFDEVQNTGNCYDKDIYVTFYGLSSDTNKPYYKVDLSVEDDYSEILTYTFNITVADGTESCISNPEIGGFTAIKDCDTQSVLLNFHAVPEHFDVINDAYSIYRREYEVYKNPNATIEGYYDELEDKFYTDEAKTTEATKSKCLLYKDLDTGYIYVYNDIFTVDEYPYQKFTLAKEKDIVRVYKGDWEPVLLKSTKTFFRDFNIKNGRTYQYIVYPNNELYGSEQLFANYDGYILKDNKIYYQEEAGSESIVYNQPYMAYWVDGDETSYKTGQPLPINYPYWTLIELQPEDIDEIDANSPIVKKKYKVDDTNIWMFKYSLETGSVVQNMNKTEIQSLSQYPKFGYSTMNADSGEISALLGSEIVLTSKERYIERLRESRVAPLSTNERVEMLNKWKEMCVSKNPKLLRDVKGSSWIVQIISNSNTPMNFVKDIPDTISFSWKQIGDTKNVIIYGDFDNDSTPEVVNTYGDESWTPVYKDRTAYGTNVCSDSCSKKDDE